jgi:hypothetical protein
MSARPESDDPRQQRAAEQAAQKVRAAVAEDHAPRARPAEQGRDSAQDRAPTQTQDSLERSRRERRERDEALQKDITSVINFMRRELTPQARAHIVEVAHQTHRDADMSPDDARVAFARAFAPTRQAQPTPDELRNLMVLSAIASVRPVNEIVADIERLQAPAVLTIKREARELLGKTTTHPSSVRALERDYERHAMTAAVNANPVAQRTAMVAAMMVSEQRARISGSGMDWDRAAAQFGAWQDVARPTTA